MAYVPRRLWAVDQNGLSRTIPPPLGFVEAFGGGEGFRGACAPSDLGVGALPTSWGGVTGRAMGEGGAVLRGETGLTAVSGGGAFPALVRGGGRERGAGAGAG